MSNVIIQLWVIFGLLFINANAIRKLHFLPSLTEPPHYSYNVSYFQTQGFMWELAKRLNGCLVFAEHRYYGSSLPFANQSFTSPAYFGFLTAEQALSDFSLLIDELKQNYTVYQSSPVIAFGGSYGGMLAAWFRLKYPNIVVGSLAASAPIWLFPGLSDCCGFSDVVSLSFATIGSENCAKNLRRSWMSIMNIASKPDGKKLLSSVFALCKPLDTVYQLINGLSDLLSTIAMVNYPYAASFLGDLPAWPVKYLCHSLSTFDEKQLDLETIRNVASGFINLFNYTGHTSCLDLDSDSSDLSASGWDLQTCMEMTTPMCARGETNVLPLSDWNVTEFAEDCKKKYGIVPRTNWGRVQFLGKELRTATNIIFSNGLIDPWSAFSVLNNSDVPLCTVINITEGAHHLDLRGSNKDDPLSVIHARAKETELITKWINEWHVQHGYINIVNKN